MSETEEPPRPPAPPEPIPSPDPAPPPNRGPDPPELTPSAGTPERRQDPGEHGYGGVQQEKEDGDEDNEHPLEDPDADPREDDSEREKAPRP